MVDVSGMALLEELVHVVFWTAQVKWWWSVRSSASQLQLNRRVKPPEFEITPRISEVRRAVLASCLSRPQQCNRAL